MPITSKVPAPTHPDDLKWPVRNWDDRSEHLPTPDFEAKNYFVTPSSGKITFLIQISPNPIVFKYKEGKAGPCFGFTSIELRVLTPHAEANVNTYYKVILPRWIIKECGRLYLDHTVYTSMGHAYMV
ncbi:hypothetical protein N7540_007683 [Penicillium herquei]|nr:hypothetical protein N7540_007683 [Penicillium herquei]